MLLIGRMLVLFWMMLNAHTFVKYFTGSKVCASIQRNQFILKSAYQGWPDAVDGLHALKKLTIIAALSNGNVRQLIDSVCTYVSIQYADTDLSISRANMLDYLGT